MILDRYLIREVLKPLVVVITVLLVLFVSYSTARFLADAADGVVPADAVIRLILLKSAIALEVLLPIALYLSVVMGLGRLHSDLEITALSASGIGELRLARPLFRLSLLIAILVGTLSLTVRPWAYAHSYLLKSKGDSEFNLNKLEPGQFHINEDENRVIFAERINLETHNMEEVFFHGEKEGKTRVIRAKRAHQEEPRPGAQIVLLFEDGYGYELDHDSSKDTAIKFKSLTLQLDESEEMLGYKRKAAHTLDLAKSVLPKDIAEFQWRCTRPLATLLLGMLAIPLSRAAPRKGKYAKIVTAILIYAAYYNLGALAKSWVEEGVVGPLPGLWWPDLLLALILVALFIKPLPLLLRLRRRLVFSG